MSIHLMHEAARRKIKPSAKLVLMCLAESARDGERRAWPGAEAMMLWANVSQPRLFALLGDLAELRLIEQTKRGQKYQRAEFVVFPDGCCEHHGPIVSGSHSRETERPVETLIDERLTAAQGLVSDAQGLVQTASGSCVRQPSPLTTPPTYLPGSSPNVIPLGEPRVTAPTGVFDEVKARLDRRRSEATA